MDHLFIYFPDFLLLCLVFALKTFSRGFTLDVNFGQLVVHLNLWSLVPLVERRSVEIEEMSSSIGANSEFALASEAARVDPPCCRFAFCVDSVNREGLDALLNLALSEVSRKCLVNLHTVGRDFLFVICVFVEHHVNCPVVEKGNLSLFVALLHSWKTLFPVILCPCLEVERLYLCPFCYFESVLVVY